MNKRTVYTGKNILQSHIETLQPIDVHDLYETIRGNQELMDETSRIRKVARMDMTAYQRVKTRLPYFCCAVFSNGIRKSENFNESVNLQDFLPGDIFQVHEGEKTEEEKPESEKKDGLPEHLYKDILKKLNPGARIPVKHKQIFIPEELNRIQLPVTAELEKLGIGIKEIRDINYGKKFIFTMGFRMGEVNLFFGMKGFSVVKSPKSGTDARLNDLGEMVIRKVLAEGEDLLKNKPETAFTLN